MLNTYLFTAVALIIAIFQSAKYDLPRDYGVHGSNADKAFGVFQGIVIMPFVYGEGLTIASPPLWLTLPFPSFMLPRYSPPISPPPQLLPKRLLPTSFGVRPALNLPFCSLANPVTFKTATTVSFYYKSLLNSLYHPPLQRLLVSAETCLKHCAYVCRCVSDPWSACLHSFL